MTTIRPNPQPQVAPQPQAGADPARLAAAKAFFALAAGRQAPPAQAAPEAVPATAPAPVNRVAETEPPQKILRPGSILDIRV